MTIVTILLGLGCIGTIFLFPRINQWDWRHLVGAAALVWLGVYLILGAIIPAVP
jgi:hypothetical protein